MNWFSLPFLHGSDIHDDYLRLIFCVAIHATRFSFIAYLNGDECGSMRFLPVALGDSARAGRARDKEFSKKF